MSDLTPELIAELRSLAQPAAELAPGRWRWHGNCKHDYHLSHWRKGWGVTWVMGFARKGMNCAQPTFLTEDVTIVRGDHIARHEVGEENIYRHDIVGFDNPLATWIAAADPTTVLELLDHIDGLERDLAAAHQKINQPQGPS